jgi:hypothetical protein
MDAGPSLEVEVARAAGTLTGPLGCPEAMDGQDEQHPAERQDDQGRSVLLNSD